MKCSTKRVHGSRADVCVRAVLTRGRTFCPVGLGGRLGGGAVVTSGSRGQTWFIGVTGLFVCLSASDSLLAPTAGLRRG